MEGADPGSQIAEFPSMKVLFLGFFHPWNDPRLHYREMALLKDRVDNIAIYYVSTRRRALQFGQPSDHLLATLVLHDEDCGDQRARRVPIINRLIHRIKRWYWLISVGRRLRPDIVQASDAREILSAILLRITAGCRLVYDSHEDYFNQAYEYGGKTRRAFFDGVKLLAIELIFLRFFDAVFCTDDYLLKKYSAVIYGIRRLDLLRNFANVHRVEVDRLHSPTDHLRLIYAGSTNQFRGVVECARYVSIFNDKFAPRRCLSFAVYGPPSQITGELTEEGLIDYHGYLDYPEMMTRLPDYDVGVCLWHSIRKFERNLPIKNFEYMAAGLPVITSNFGNLKKYIEEAGCGFCIDPHSYEQFEAAILQLFDAAYRQELAANGIAYAREHASFEKEAGPYLQVYVANEFE